LGIRLSIKLEEVQGNECLAYTARNVYDEVQWWKQTIGRSL